MPTDYNEVYYGATFIDNKTGDEYLIILKNKSSKSSNPIQTFLKFKNNNDANSCADLFEKMKTKKEVFPEKISFPNQEIQLAPYVVETVFYLNNEFDQTELKKSLTKSKLTPDNIADLEVL